MSAKAKLYSLSCRLSLSIAAAVLVGCADSREPASLTNEAHVEALRSAALGYYAAASAKDRAGVVSFYDSTAVLLPPGAEPVTGTDGVGSYRFGFIETPGVQLQFDLQRAVASADGQVGWTVAVGDITIDRGAEPPGRDRVRDVHTWQRQSDGSWKIVVDVWNSEPPVP